jgi:hypothetical protein
LQPLDGFRYLKTVIRPLRIIDKLDHRAIHKDTDAKQNYEE